MSLNQSLLIIDEVHSSRDKIILGHSPDQQGLECNHLSFYHEIPSRTETIRGSGHLSVLKYRSIRSPGKFSHKQRPVAVASTRGKVIV